MYCDATQSSVSAFQRAHGLPVDGVCDATTWHTLVEAGWGLGDRVLYLRSPNLRGDDVGELQRHLGRLGFDPGRLDGIFGPSTEHALAEFQRNVGLTADGVCGKEAVRALQRLRGRTTPGPAVTAVREYERLSHGIGTLSGRRVVIGQLDGRPTPSRLLARSLRLVGVSVLTIDESEGSHHADAANGFGAEVYLGLAVANERTGLAYYATTGFESLGGRRLAELLFDELIAIPLPVSHPAGMRLPVLRETRMPAVVVELGPAPAFEAKTPVVVAAMARALAQWVVAPVPPRPG